VLTTVPPHTQTATPLRCWRWRGASAPRVAPIGA